MAVQWADYSRIARPQVLTPEFNAELAAETLRLNTALPHNPGQRYQGTHLDVRFDDNPFYDRLAKWQPARDALAAMGMDDFHSAGGLIVLTKEARAPTLYWHQDWMHWNDPLSLTPWPQTVFLSYYLQVGTSLPRLLCTGSIDRLHMQNRKLLERYF